MFDRYRPVKFAVEAASILAVAAIASKAAVQYGESVIESSGLFNTTFYSPTAHPRPLLLRDLKIVADNKGGSNLMFANPTEATNNSDCYAAQMPMAWANSGNNTVKGSAIRFNQQNSTIICLADSVGSVALSSVTPSH